MKKKILSVVAILMIAAMLTVVLTACVPGSAEKAKEKMKKADYVAENTGFSIGSIEDSFFAVNADGDSVLAIWYKETEDAKAAEEDLGVIVKAFLKAKKLEDAGITRSGKCLYTGTEQGIKDFKAMF